MANSQQRLMANLKLSRSKPYDFRNRIFDEGDEMRSMQIKFLLGKAAGAVLVVLVCGTLGCQLPDSYLADNRPIPQGAEFELQRIAIADRCHRAKKQLEVFENDSLGPDWLDIASEKIQRVLTLHQDD